MKQTKMTIVAKAINEQRNSFEGILLEFRAMWAKENRAECSEEYARAKEVLKKVKNDHKGEEGFDVHSTKESKLVFAYDAAFARAKSIEVDEEVKTLIRDMRLADNLKFRHFTWDFLWSNLPSKYINEEFEIYENKKNRVTGVMELVPVQRWTVAKVGRYFRMAVNERNEKNTK